MSVQPESPEGPKPLKERGAAELAAPVRERAEKLSARAKHKATAEELMQRSRERSSAKALTAPERRERNAGRVKTGTGIALLLAAGVTLFVMNDVRAETARAEAAHQSRVFDQKSEIAYLEDLTGSKGGQGVDPVLQIEDVQVTLDRARRDAVEVAALQNQFPAILAANTAEPGNGAPSQGFLDAVEHRRTLEPFFDKGTHLVAEDMIYTPTSVFGLDAAEIDPRTQWFQRKADAGPYSWSVASVAGSETLDVSRAEVVWLAQDETTGDLLAWASGTWSSEAEAFTKLTVGTTAYGDSQNAQAAAVTEAEATEAGR